MKKQNRIGGLLWLVLGIGLCLGSVKLKIGELRNPGAGFIPFLTGCLLSVCGFVLLLSRGADRAVLKAPRRFFVPLLTLGIVFIYAVFLEPLGFLLATLFFLFSLFKFVEPGKWLMPFLLSLTTVVLSYLVFSVWLRSQFPKGILGF